MNRSTALAVLAAKLTFGASMAAGLALGAHAHAGLAPHPTPPASVGNVVAAPSSQCEEDQACWDCATMGNRDCGTDIASIVTARVTYWAGIYGS